MGKNRRSTGNTSPSSKIDVEELANKIAQWESSGADSPTANMTKEELDYIKEHEEILNYQDEYGRPINHLYRLDRPSRFTKSGDGDIDDILKELKVGDVLGESLPKDPSTYRSFTDDVYAHYQYVSSHWGWGSAVILRTHGNVTMFDPKKYADVYPGEKEIWADKSKLKIDNFTRIKGDNISEELRKELHLNSMYDVAQKDVLIIDVSPVGDNSYQRRDEIQRELQEKYPKVPVDDLMYGSN